MFGEARKTYPQSVPRKHSFYAQRYACANALLLLPLSQQSTHKPLLLLTTTTF